MTRDIKEVQNRYKKGQRCESIISHWRNDQISKKYNLFNHILKEEQGFPEEARGLSSGKEVRECVLGIPMVVRDPGGGSPNPFSLSKQKELNFNYLILLNCLLLVPSQQIIHEMYNNEHVNLQ